MDLSAQQTIYRGNALPGIVQTLAEQLGVSTESLERLGIGWKIDSNAWSFPERDAEGNIIGISLRGWKGKKFCVKGSKRGLIYDRTALLARSGSTVSYDAGSQNWRRVSADIPCPICGKPDWCLVSAECPDDPKPSFVVALKRTARWLWGEAATSIFGKTLATFDLPEQWKMGGFLYLWSRGSLILPPPSIWAFPVSVAPRQAGVGLFYVRYVPDGTLWSLVNTTPGPGDKGWKKPLKPLSRWRNWLRNSCPRMESKTYEYGYDPASFDKDYSMHFEAEIPRPLMEHCNRTTPSESPDGGSKTST